MWIKGGKVVHAKCQYVYRFQSGFFFRHPMLDEYDYYWRIEPYVDYYCQIDYDVFKYMRNNAKKYGKSSGLGLKRGKVYSCADKKDICVIRLQYCI